MNACRKFVYSCLFLILLGNASFLAAATLVVESDGSISGINNLDIGGAAYDVTFHVGLPFRSIWDLDGDWTFDDNDGSLFNQAPKFWLNGPGAEQAAQAITAALGTTNYWSASPQLDAVIVPYTWNGPSNYFGYRDTNSAPAIDTGFSTSPTLNTSSVSSSVVIASFTPAGTQLLPDQVGASVISGGYNSPVVQTFTPGKENVAGVDIYINGTAAATQNVTVSLYSDSAYTDLLATATIADHPANTIAEFRWAAVTVTPETLYYLRFQTGLLNVGALVSNTTDPYERGDIIAGGGNLFFNFKDAQFITYYDPSFGAVDSDNDGVPDGTDNCPTVANADQANSDGADDGGDACDTDDDNDNWLDVDDNCPIVANPNQEDGNGDGVGDACDADSDGVSDDVDNCPSIANANQFNFDGADDGGDACDPDDDNDGRLDGEDNCPKISNPDQEPSLSEPGRGVACEGLPPGC